MRVTHSHLKWIYSKIGVPSAVVIFLMKFVLVSLAVIICIKVGRTFDELHLLHAAHWSDMEGKAIARLQLNYSDGTRRTMDLGYGVHVRDWQRLHSEEREAVTDPSTKVIWRGAGLSVPVSNWVTVDTPLYTSKDGTGIVKFPTDKTWCIIFNASKKGWHAVSEQMTLGEPAEPANGLVVTIHLSPDSDTEVDTTLAG
jgi:hypothetical protein